MTTAATVAARGADDAWRERWPALLGLAVLAIPTFVTLGQQFWSKEIGAHGPIIMAVGAWLLFQEFFTGDQAPSPGNSWITAALIVPGILVHLFGRLFGFLVLEVGGLYLIVLSVLQSWFGLRRLLQGWFPLLFLGLSVPPPTWVIDTLTAPLKIFATTAGTDISKLMGLPVEHQGAMILVGQYQLEVEDACSGMHSIIGLVETAMLYSFLMHGRSWKYLLFFTALSIPLAVISNSIRIVVLITITYFFGNEAAQGFLHFTAGILLFSIALAGVFVCDQILQRVIRSRGKASQ